MNSLSLLDLQASTLALAPQAQRAAMAAELQTALLRAGVYPASLSPVYQALGEGKLAPMTIPAFNLRGLTYSLARAIWRAARKVDAGPVLFELAPAEADTGDQTFEEFAAMVLAAAAREGWRGPVFLQGDHFEVESEQDLQGVTALAQRVAAAGFHHIDIDASHLYDSISDELRGFHRPNARATAALLSSLRGCVANGAELTLGGEVGEIGGRNTTPQDLLAFAAEFSPLLQNGTRGLNKISAQTGTTHGGIVKPDGSVGRMAVDFELARSLSDQARALGWAGLVQHGASTLTIEDLSHLPEAGVVEVHMATQIQNIVFDHPAFPKGLLEEMRGRLVPTRTNAEGDIMDGDEHQSAQQNFYRARWTAWGTFKQPLWNLPEEVLHPVGETLEAWVADVLNALKLQGRGDVIRSYYTEVNR
jgi:fructose/tagatose bisphosphate aldolase